MMAHDTKNQRIIKHSTEIRIDTDKATCAQAIHTHIENAIKKKNGINKQQQ